MRVAVVGSRNANESHYPLLADGIPQNASEIISGGASGADTLAARYAEENGLRLNVFLPDYTQHGNKAPLMRNAEIVDAADYIVALWDTVSRGTGHVIRLCIEKNKPFKIIKF